MKTIEPTLILEANHKIKFLNQNLQELNLVIKKVLSARDDTITYLVDNEGIEGILTEYIPQLENRVNIFKRNEDNHIILNIDDPFELQKLKAEIESLKIQYSFYYDLLMDHDNQEKQKLLEAINKNQFLDKIELTGLQALFPRRDINSGLYNLDTSYFFLPYEKNSIDLNTFLEKSEQTQEYFLELIDIFIQLIHLSKRYQFGDKLYLECNENNFFVIDENTLSGKKLDFKNISYINKDNNSDYDNVKDLIKFITAWLRLFFKFDDEESLNNSELLNSFSLKDKNILVNSLESIFRHSEFGDSFDDEPYTELDQLLIELENIINVISPSDYSNPIMWQDNVDQVLDEGDYLDYLRKISVLNALYKYPFTIPEKESENIVEEIKIGIFGSGNFGRVIIDTFLQTTQIIDHIPNIDVYTHNDLSSSTKYIEARPGLKDFVEIKIDNKPLNEENSIRNLYGKLNFKKLNTSNKKEDFFNSGFYYGSISNDEIKFGLFAFEFLSSSEKSDYNIICYSLGDDYLNREMAIKTTEFFKEHYPDEKQPDIYYVQKDKINVEKINEDPVSLSKNAKVYPILLENKISETYLEKMAFNLHLLWNELSSRQNINDIYLDFLEDNYHHVSSIATILGLIENLIQISSEEVRSPYIDDIVGTSDFKDFMSSSSKLEEYICDLFLQSNKEEFYHTYFKLLLNLILPYLTERDKTNLRKYLHRNWIIGKITDGWITPLSFEEDLTTFANLLIDDESFDYMDEKIHPRLLDSSGEYIENQYWERKVLSESIDDLSRFNIIFFQGNQSKVRDLYNSYPIKYDLEILKIYISNKNSYLQNNYDNLLRVLKNVENGSYFYSYNFDSYFYIFKKNLEKIDKEIINESDREGINLQLDIIYRKMKPLVDSNLRKELNRNNIEIVNNLEFLFFNDYDKYLVQNLNLQTNLSDLDLVLETVLPIYYLDPLEITFLVPITGKKDVEKFFKLFYKIFHTFQLLSIGSNIFVKFITFLDKENPNEEVEEFINYFNKNEKNFKSDNSSINKVDFSILTFEDSGIVMELEFQEFLKKLNDEDNKEVIFNTTQPLFSDSIKENSFKKIIKDLFTLNFEYDLRKNVFKSINESENLIYLNINNFPFSINNFIDLNFSNVGIEDAVTSEEYDILDNWIDLSKDYYEPFKQTSMNLFVPDFKYNYKSIWKIIYPKKENQRLKYFYVWYILTSFFKVFTDFQRTDRFYFELKPKTSNSNKPLNFFYYLYDLNYEVVNYILDFLIKNNLIGKESTITSVASDTIRIDIKDSKIEEAELKKLLTKPDHLVNLDQIDTYQVDKKHIIKYDNNKIYHFNLSLDFISKLTKISKKNIRTMLNYYYNNLVSFFSTVNLQNAQNNDYSKSDVINFHSFDLKQLFTSPELLILTYIYYELLSTHKFDDIQLVSKNKLLQVSHNDYTYKTEYALILTKGIKKIVIYMREIQIPRKDTITNNKKEKYFFNIAFASKEFEESIIEYGKKDEDCIIVKISINNANQIGKNISKFNQLSPNFYEITNLEVIDSIKNSIDEII